MKTASRHPRQVRELLAAEMMKGGQIMILITGDQALRRLTGIRPESRTLPWRIRAHLVSRQGRHRAARVFGGRARRPCRQKTWDSISAGNGIY